MFDDETIRLACGPVGLEYLGNKHRGGVSGQKGTRYEDYYAVYRFAEFAGESYTEAGGLNGNESLEFLSQVKCFVDDLVIRGGRLSGEQFYQLRNVQDLSWGSGGKSLAWNFENQKTLSMQAGYDCNCCVVVPDEELRATLAEGMPSKLAKFSEVQYFPWLETLDRYIRSWPEFYEAIASLSAYEQPTYEKCLPVARGLLAAWVDAGANPVRMENVLRELQSTSSYVRPIEGERQLSDEFVEALAQVENFVWWQERGYFHWRSADGLDSGTLTYNCHTPRFELFIAWVTNNGPTSLDDLTDGGWLA